MSNEVNDIILERAADMCEYWEGTLHAELIRHALDSNDLDNVRQAVAIAEGEAAQQEMRAYNTLPDAYEEVY